MSGLVGKRVWLTCRAWASCCRGFDRGDFELGTVPWPPADLPCCEAYGTVSPSCLILFGRHSTLSSELARTRGIRLSN